MKECPEKTFINKFISDWEIDEESNRHLFYNEQKNVKEITSPIERGDLVFNERLELFSSKEKYKRFAKYKQNKITLIKWPYDNMEHHNSFNEKNKARETKYLCRVNTSDCHGNHSLPIEIYPLKYLAYWVLMNDVHNVKYNCLCYFNYFVYSKK